MNIYMHTFGERICNIHQGRKVEKAMWISMYSQVHSQTGIFQKFYPLSTHQVVSLWEAEFKSIKAWLKVTWELRAINQSLLNQLWMWECVWHPNLFNSPFPFPLSWRTVLDLLSWSANCLTSYFTEKIKVIPRKLPQILTSSSTQLWTLAHTCSLFPPITLDKVIHAST